MAITKQEAVSRARELAPEIARRAPQTEALRKPHDASIQSLIDADLLGLLVPKKHGGHELGLDAMAEVVFEVSRACMSTGWIAAFYIGHNWVASRIDPRAQAEVFNGKNYACIPASTAPALKAKRVPDGWTVSGRAPWGSGIMHADWVIMGGSSEEGEASSFLLPIEDVTIEDTWHMTGMSGTGSNDMICENAFVPDHRAQVAATLGEGASEGAKLHNNPDLYEIPLMPFAYCETMGVYVGGLRGAVDAFHDTLKSRVRNFTHAVVREKQISHLQLGEAYAAADIAEELMRGQIQMTQEAVKRGMTKHDRIRLKAHAGFVVNHCRQSVNELIANSGASSFGTALPLQRFFRDINMLSTHAFFEWSTAREQYGRMQLGLEPSHLLF